MINVVNKLNKKEAMITLTVDDAQLIHDALARARYRLGEVQGTKPFQVKFSDKYKHYTALMCALGKLLE